MKKYSAEEKEDLIEAWKESGKSKWAFAKEHELIPQTFLKWVAKKDETINFVELTSKLKPSKETNQKIILERGNIKFKIPSEITQQGIEVVKTLWEILT